MPTLESPPVTPWWLKAVPVARCAERPSSEVSCKYYTLASTVCRVEQQSGTNARKCERLLRKLRDCGRGLEEIEVEREELTENNFRGSEADLHDPDRLFRVPSTSQLSNPLDANVGDAIEEFMHYAEELKQHVAKEPPAGQSPQMRTGSAERREDVWPRRGFLSRMFARQAECSPGRRRPNERTWEEYAKDFQEVTKGLVGAGTSSVFLLINLAKSQYIGAIVS